MQAPPGYSDGVQLAWEISNARTRPQRRKLFRDWCRTRDVSGVQLRQLLALMEPIIQEAHELLARGST